MFEGRSVTGRFGAGILLATTALAAAAPAYAQDNSDSNVIIVTAQKREQNLQDVPVAITALGTEKLAQLHVNDLDSVVKYLPSVTIETLGPGFSQVYFRAVASGENANHSGPLPTVGTYLDEMPITTIQGALDIHAYDLARVEALAGPQGTLYGASSMAGTIKMVTNKPDMSGSYGAADFEVNTISHGAMGGMAEGFYNFRISDSAAARLVGWYRHDGGYIDNVHGCRTYPTSGVQQCNDALVKNNYNDVDTYGARLALGIELNDSWTIRPTVMGQVQNANGSFAQERSSAVTDKLQTVQYNPEYSKDKWIQAALTIEGKIGNWDVVATGGHLWRNDEVVSDYSDYSYFYDKLHGYGAYFVDNNGDPVNPNQYIQGKDRYRRLFGEFRVSSPADSRLRLIAGVFGQRQSHHILQNYIIDGIADSLKVPGTKSDIWLTAQDRVDRDLAAFGELTFDLTDKLSVTAGGRVYYYKNSLDGFFGYNNPGYSSNPVYACQGPATVQDAPCDNLNKVTSDSGFIHKLNATYKITKDVMVYATWSRGFRPGGINRRGSLPPYGADTLDNYELGWKTQFGPLRFNGAVYQEDWKNIQLSFLGANGLTEIRNAGIARIRGVEVDVGYNHHGLSIDVSGSYNDATIRRDFCLIANADFDCTTPGNDLLAPAGTQLPVTPKFKGNAVVRYEFPIGGLNAHVQASASHVSTRRSDLRLIENGIKGDLAAYTTVDVSFGVKFDKYRVEVYATNLFDSNGVENTSVQCLETVCGDPTHGTPGGGVFYDYVVKPRIIGLKFGADF